MFSCFFHVLGTEHVDPTSPTTGESVRLMTASPRIVRRFDRLWWQLQQGQSLVTGSYINCPHVGRDQDSTKCDWKLLHASVHFDRFRVLKRAHDPHNPLTVHRVNMVPELLPGKTYILCFFSNVQHSWRMPRLGNIDFLLSLPSLLQTG